MIINNRELMNFVRKSLYDELYVELSEEWEDEQTEYYNANWVKNIKEAEDITELKQALVRIIRGLSAYLQEEKF